jgi:hypothetical protein
LEGGFRRRRETFIDILLLPSPLMGEGKDEGGARKGEK